MVMKSIIGMNSPNGMLSRNQLTTINQSQLNAQLSLNMAGPNGAHASPSPPVSKSATPSPASSINEDEQDEGNRVGWVTRHRAPSRRRDGRRLVNVFFFSILQVIAEKRPAPVDPAKKPKTPKKKKKKDPNEPQKPVSAYALFFRDTQAAIKGQNPNATFGEVSKIVASMWDGLGEEQKQVGQRLIGRTQRVTSSEVCVTYAHTLLCVIAALQKQNGSGQEGISQSPRGVPSQPGVQGEERRTPEDEKDPHLTSSSVM